MGLFCTVSKINGDFSRKSQIFPTPVYFAPLLKGFPLELCIGTGYQKLEWWGYQAEQEVWQYLQPYGYNTPTWQTDGLTDTGRQQRVRLCMESCGKNWRECLFLVNTTKLIADFILTQMNLFILVVYSQQKKHSLKYTHSARYTAINCHLNYTGNSLQHGFGGPVTSPHYSEVCVILKWC